MKINFTAAVAVTFFSCCLVTPAPAVSAPTSFRVTIPLRFGGHRDEPARMPSAAELRTERRLRFVRYGFQIADAIVSAIGYHSYQKCLSCLAFPGGGPRGSAAFSAANINGGRPAEVDPLIQPLSGGGFASLALGTLAYDVVDTRIEHHWSVQHREAADIAEIGAHAWGIATWVPEIANMHRDAAIAASCGAQWQAKAFGQAFSDGCVNRFYRSGAAPSAPLGPVSTLVVCAPARFKRGTFLFATPGDNIIASGVPCLDSGAPPP